MKPDYSHYFWQGEKVRLRPLQLEDAERYFFASLDSPSRQVLQLGMELPSSLELERQAMEKYAGCKEVNGVIVFAIETHGGELVGGLSLHSVDEKNGVFSFGVSIHREHWGHGYAEDAVRMLLRYGFHEQRFQKCNSACIAENKASIRLHQKLGFKEEGLRRRQVFFNGIYHDDVLFGLTREEFDAQEQDV